MSETSNPQRRGIENQRKTLSKWHRTPQWLAFRDEHARTPDAVCFYCGKKHGEQRIRLDGEPKVFKTGKRKGQPVLVILTVNHESRKAYISLEAYCTWTEDTKVCCDLCNLMFEKGKKPCPVCKARYIMWYEQECDHCYYEKHPDELKEKLENIADREERNRQFKKKMATKRRVEKRNHPCANHLVGQGCKKSEFKCTYSPKKVENCPSFYWKRR